MRKIVRKINSLFDENTNEEHTWSLRCTLWVLVILSPFVIDFIIDVPLVIGILSGITLLLAILRVVSDLGKIYYFLKDNQII